MSPGLHLEGAVGHISGGIRPGGVALHDVLTQRHGVGEGADVQEVGAVVGQLHHEGVVVGSGHAQLLLGQLAGDNLVGVLHHGDDGVVGGGGGGIHQAAPGVHEVVGGDGLAVRPLGVVAQGEGVGKGAVTVVGDLGLGSGHAQIQLSGGAVAAVAGGIAVNPLVQALEQVADHDVAVHSPVQAGIHGLRLRREADTDGVGAGSDRAGLRGRGLSTGRRGLLGGGAAAAAGQQADSQRRRQTQSKDSALLHLLVPPINS